ncbi:MAG: molybdopterin-dependent oxidoreductase [Candidatus Margulisiibacteriota bacterium]
MVNDKYEIRRSTCLFCSLGCGLAFRAKGESVVAIDYDRENPINHGALCPRGYYNFELLNHPQRLNYPRIGNRNIAWSEAVEYAKRGLKEFGGESTAIAVSCLASNEDALMAARLANEIGTKNIAPVGSFADIEAYQGMSKDEKGLEGTSMEEIGNCDALLIIGDLLTRSAVMAQYVNKVKYAKRGNKIIVVDSNSTHTAWFATNHVKNASGTEALVLAGVLNELLIKYKGKEGAIDLSRSGLDQAAIRKIAEEFDSASAGAILFVPGADKNRNDLISYFISEICKISKNKKEMTLYEYGNTVGVNAILDREAPGHISQQGLLDKINKEEIKTILMLGEDLSFASPELEKKIRLMKFVALSSYFDVDWADRTTVVFPLASHMEDGGDYSMADGKERSLTAIAEKTGGKTNAEIVAMLLGAEIDKDEVSHAARNTLKTKIDPKQEDLHEKIKEAELIDAKEKVEQMNITHFGSNNLARKFYWFRANNNDK